MWNLLGPNATTFIVPGECFPTRYRSTYYGISAASGKLGAVIAQSMTAILRGGHNYTNDTNHRLPLILKWYVQRSVVPLQRNPVKVPR